MAQPLYLTYMRVFVPCIDYVAWDEDGNIMLQSRNENDVDLEMNDHERTFPLMNTNNSDMVENSNETIPTVASRLSTLHWRRTSRVR